MKKFFTILAVLVIGTITVFGQSPEMMKYQTVIRNSSGEILKNQPVAFQISILQGSATGFNVYTETQSKITNEFGLVNLEIGTGTLLSGSFSSINWGTGIYFVKIELDIANGNNFVLMGTSQLLSVPYALHAKTVQNYTETDPVFGNSAAKNVTLNSISNWNNAFSWGNHVGLYKLISYVPTWAEIISKPSTLEGFGISDAMNISHPANSLTSDLIGNWNAAYSWGNHAGLYKSYSYVPTWLEITSRPSTLAGYGINDAMSVLHPANDITSILISNWNDAFSWGNHAGLYKPNSYVPTWLEITSRPSTLAGYGINDAMSVLHPANNITSNFISNWNDAFSWGNHSTAGYLKNETDPLFINSPAYNVTSTSISNWNTAFGWGNHAGLYRPLNYVPEWNEIMSNPFLFSDPTKDQLLKYNSTNSKWENWTPDFIPLSGPFTRGDIIYFKDTTWVTLPKGNEAQVLKIESGLPKWKPLSEYGSVIPSANFIVSQLLGSTTHTFFVDASDVIDDVDAVATLEVRWKWDDAGAFTAWSTVKTASHIYNTEGVKNITLEVKDSHGNIGTSSKAINIDNSFFFPVVFTISASNLTSTGLNCGGNIVSDGGTDITARGVCWSIFQNPTLANDKTTNGTGIGFFTSTITGLAPGTIYYIRAYATNSEGTSYGNQISIQTVLNVVFPTVTTTAVTNITANAATSGGIVTATGGAEVTSRGVCWSDHQNPTISDNLTSDGTGTGQFQSQVSGLIPGTYYLRAYATNSSGTGYGNMVSFTTEKTLPVLTTKNITEISAMGAVSGGNISSAGGGTLTGRGICWSDAPDPTIANEKTTSTSTASSFSAAIAKASPGTTYYVRAYATNEIGTGYGDQKTFTTSNAQYHTSFESGMTPANWSGPFTVTNERAFDGSYSFKSLRNQDCDAIFNITLSSPGQVSFYYSFIDKAVSIEFYIDDVMIATFPNDGQGWRQGLVNITSGGHILKWHYIDETGSSPGGPYAGNGFIDHITITD